MVKSGKYPSSLWNHQKEALRFLVEHLNAKQQKGPCLVRMPTGTGKTGVIAWLSMKSNAGTTLVLTPWTNLRDQMVAALTKEFWVNLNLAPPTRRVASLRPSSASKVLADPDVKVIVSTLAALTDLRRNDEKIYSALQNKVDLVIVDEGHYEPAVEWGKSVKCLDKPTVLMTATPYRNDLKLFHISDAEKAVWQLRHIDAQNNGIIRQLEFQSLGSDTASDRLLEAFTNFWKNAKQRNELVSVKPRAIICCADSDQIKSVVRRLRAEGISSLGVHDRFDNRPGDGLYRNVPPLNTDAEVWVHQYKLIEGLDDHRFCCVALFCAIQNDRKLVQQIGRTLRKHESDRDGKSAVLLAPDEFDVESSWQAYLDFEKTAQLVTIGHYRAVVEKLLAAQPNAEYFDGRFRKRFDSSHFGKDPKITVSPSVLVRQVSKSFSFDEYIKDCTDTLLMDDAIILGSDSFGPCVRANDHALWVYASIRNSRLLEQDALYEVRLEAHCAVVDDGYLFISDTGGSYPTEVLEDKTTGIEPLALSSLLDGSFRLTNLSVDSAIPFDNVVRAAEIRGADIAKIPASLTDRVQICRSARGASTKHGRRYVGMKRGRIRQELSGNQLRSHSLSTFVAWCQNVTKTLQSGAGSSNNVFSRYMQTCLPPSNLVAKSICIDLFRMGTQLLNQDGQPVRIKKSAANMEPVLGNPNAYAFSLEFEELANNPKGIVERFTAEYQDHKKRFWFKGCDDSQIRVDVSDPRFSDGRSLQDYLNVKQDLVLIGLSGGEVVYQGRNFYTVDYRNAEKSLLHRITTLPKVNACSTEKGTNDELETAKGLNGSAKHSKFATGSLFNAIVSEDNVIPFIPDVLVCDDLNTECADFVAADTVGRKLALLHAKTGEGNSISASAFHEVVAQAIKNLAYLSPNAETPNGASSWAAGRYWNKTAVERIIKIPANLKTGIDLWDKLKSDIIQSADGELHVVLVTAGCCNRTALQEAIDDSTKRTPETAQLFHLLEGLNGYARQLGIKLTIVDIPFDNKHVAAKAAAKAAAKRAVTAPAKPAAKAAKILPKAASGTTGSKPAATRKTAGTSRPNQKGP